MKLIINCDDDKVGTALQILNDEIPDWREKYQRVGWGWNFRCRPSFFVRRLTDGLSITQNKADSLPSNSTVEKG